MENNRLNALLDNINTKRIVAHLKALEGEREPQHSPEALRAAGRYIKGQMADFGLQVRESLFSSEQMSTLDADGMPCFNVVGMQPHTQTTENRIVIGAHYDTVIGSPGADDNASSLAVLLETARVLAPLQGDLPLEFVAFSLEEPGFVGSRAYLKNVLSQQKRIQLAIILECVGYTDHRPGTQRTPPGIPISLPDKADFIGLLGSEPAKDFVTAFVSAGDRHTPELPVISLVLPKAAEALPAVRRSDHVPFWDENIPAVMFTDTADFRSPHYHQKTDTLDTLDMPFMTQITKALCASIIDLAVLN